MTDISDILEYFTIEVLFERQTFYKNLLLKYNLKIESNSGKKELHHP